MSNSKVKTKYKVAYGRGAEHQKNFDCFIAATQFLAHSEEANGCKYRLIYERKIKQGKTILELLVDL